MAKQDDFMRQLRATFRIEAAEHLHALADGLEKLAADGDAPDRAGLIESIYRAAHSLKGAARAADFLDIESLCESLETTFAAWRRGSRTPTQADIEGTHAVLDRMTAALSRDSAPPPAPPVRSAIEVRPVEPPTTVTAPASPPEFDTVRVSLRTLDQRLLEAEELLAAKLSATQRRVDLDELAPLLESWRKEWVRVQPEARALRQAPNASLADFFEWNQDWLRTLESRIAGLRRAANQDQVNIGKLVDDLLENSKRMLMLPMATLAPLLRKVVRDLGRELAKDTELVIRGDDLGVDKRILEEMKDPLVHLLRNCVDHGIERADIRAANGKPARATIAVTVSQVNGHQVEIAVRDDGAGIDVERVRAQAIARGLVSATAAAAMEASAVQSLIFESDLSTRTMITQLSGRGLGLAIVREKAEKLGGRVNVESQPGLGTTVRMTLPLTLTTSRGVLVECARRTFVVPTAQVERVTRFRPADVRTVEGRETLAYDGRPLALVQLADVLELPESLVAHDSAARPALILGSGSERIAFAVDAVLDEREVLVKRLRKPLLKVRNIAGATVLGTGQVAPILDVTGLIRSARRTTRRTPSSPPAPNTPARRVLVAEDSITSRMLLKSILESAGYVVKTAVDGLEAYTLLRSETFDVLVSDVEMPRLNGFDLTARLRADRQLTELPVVLVTALSSREDRERGIEVGANAYLVKSDLDQNNLLDTLRRLA
jgi:two-component system, chemotaxis family, sensor kinase CheA